MGLVAASIGALYTVFARWGIAHGLSSPDLTVLRFGVAGVFMLPVFALAWRRDEVQLSKRWKVWLMVTPPAPSDEPRRRWAPRQRPRSMSSATGPDAPPLR